MRVSREGINATISGSFQACRDFSTSLSSFDERFKNADFKFIDDLAKDRMFKDCKVLPVKELVYYDIDIEAPLAEGGQHLAADAFHSKLKDSNSVIIDVRNAYETDIGRFEKQEGQGGAQLILPEMRKSTDFVPWIRSKETQERLKGKDVLMYCTGGVRCERASALLKQEEGSAIGGVFQLHGGIEKYLQIYPDGGFFRGKNFVFDKREAIGAGCVNGVGGVLEKGQDGAKKKKKKMKKNGTNNHNQMGVDSDAEIMGACCVCEAVWDRYIGKKKCDTCAVPVLMCQSCCTEMGAQKKSHGSQLQGRFRLIRCPLCQKQKCTTRASDLEFTENGKKTKSKDEGASATVCKWGGGHSKKKAALRKEVNGKRTVATAFADKPCKFGKECTRSDCWFKH